MASLHWKKTGAGKVYPYVVEYIDGKYKWISLSAYADLGRKIVTQKEARKYFNQWKQAHKKDKPKDDSQLASLLTDYLKRSAAENTASTHKSNYSRVEILRQYFVSRGILCLSDLTPASINQFKSWKGSSCTATTVRRYLEVLRHFLNVQVQEGRLNRNPMAKVKLPKKNATPQIRALSEKEIKIIETKFPSPYREFCMIGYLAGLRRAEIIHLEWSDINFDQMTITIAAKTGFAPKGRTPETIPLAPQLSAVLRSLERAGRYIFDKGTNHPLYFSEVWYRRVIALYRKFGIDGANIHTLRHTYCTRLVRAGVSLPIVQKLARHKRYETTLQYSHLDQSDLQKAINKLPGQSNIRTRRK